MSIKTAFKITPKVLGLTAITSGLYHGFVDSQGIPVNGGLESVLTYGPALLWGGYLW